MRGNIVIFTDFYMEGVISVVENSALSVALTAVSTYKECLETLATTPNLLGCLCIDHQATKKTQRFYKDVVSILDRIAQSAERTTALSVMYKSKFIPGFLYATRSAGVTISTLRFTNLNEEMIRLDGLTPILISTLGIFKTVTPKFFEISASNQAGAGRDSMIESFVYFLSETATDDVLVQHFKRHPELRKVWSLQESDEYLDDCKEMFGDSVFWIFCEMMLDKRKPS